jgi:hypothetical protein
MRPIAADGSGASPATPNWTSVTGVMQNVAGGVADTHVRSPPLGLG